MHNAGLLRFAPEHRVNGRFIILLTAALSLNGAPSLAQTTHTDTLPAAQAGARDSGDRPRQGDDALANEDNVYEEHAHAPPADLPGEDVDVTVGVGGSAERAPRDIREPFDE